MATSVRVAGLRGIAEVDRLDRLRRQDLSSFPEDTGLPEEPLPKPQDAAGVEADICLCVPGAEPLATAAKGFTFVLLTQPEEGDRVISLQVVSKLVTSTEVHHDWLTNLYSSSFAHSGLTRKQSRPGLTFVSTRARSETAVRSAHQCDCAGCAAPWL